MKSLLSLTGLGVVLLILNYAIFHFLGIEFRWVIGVLYVYMVLLSFVFDRVLTTKDNAKQFVITYMGFSGGKMFLSLFVLLIYVFLNRDYMLPFAISFLAVYFSFTAFEIVRLLRFFKK